MKPEKKPEGQAETQMRLAETQDIRSEKRYMTKNSIFAIHSSSVGGEHMNFDYSHLNTELSFMNGNHARLKKIYLSETKLSDKKIDKALFYDSLTIFSYEKCLKKGIVGKVLESTCDIF